MANTPRDFSKIQEKRIADLLGGKVHPNSGAVEVTSAKGDVSKAHIEWGLLIEGKTTMTKPSQSGKRSITLKKEWFAETKRHCFDAGLDIPIVVVSFDNKTDYFCIEDIDFANMYRALIDYANLVEELQQEIKELKNKLEETK